MKRAFRYVKHYRKERSSISSLKNYLLNSVNTAKWMFVTNWLNILSFISLSEILNTHLPSKLGLTYFSEKSFSVKY